MEIQVLGTRNLHEALDRLGQTYTALDPPAYGALLKECANARELGLGRNVHASIAKHGLSDRATYLGNCLVHMYGKCGSVEDARKVFERISRRNVYSTNVMIAAFAESGHADEAKMLFDRCTVRNRVTWNTMITAYINCAAVGQALDLFQEMPERDVVSWTAVITASAAAEALLLFRRMDLDGVRPNRVTFMSVLEACADLEEAAIGIIIHGLVREIGLESELKIANSLIHMYGSCGKLEQAIEIFQLMPQKSTVSWNAMLAAYAWSGDINRARRTFDQTPQKDVVSWNSMLAAYSQAGHNEKAIDLFFAMEIQANEVTFVTAVDACANLAAIEPGIVVHSRATSRGFDADDVRVANALLNLYTKCCAIDRAEAVFAGMRVKDTVSWTTMITAYTQAGHPSLALQTLRTMDLEGVKLDGFTYVAALDACAISTPPATTQGRWIHARAVFHGYAGDPLVGNAFVNVLGKSGSVDAAKGAFDGIQSKDAVSLNCMIGIYAANGAGEAAMDAVRCMALEGVNPDSVTFMSVLSGCSHSGLIDVAWEMFPCMAGDFGIVPGMDHYVSLLDLLVRAGRMDEAMDLIDNMPFEPPALAWTIVRGGCRANAMARTIELEPANAAHYI